MKKDITVKAIQMGKRIWREAKKPVLRTRMDGDITLLPNKECSEKGQPKAVIKADIELTLLYLLLAMVAASTILKALCKLFR